MAVEIENKVREAMGIPLLPTSGEDPLDIPAPKAKTSKDAKD